MTLWGGRFEGGPSEVTRVFTEDDSDRRLLEVDIRGSLAHVAMLGRTGIITEAEAEELTRGLEQILDSVDEFGFAETDEDVHTAVERRLGELVGEVAGKLHTGRSRNDQIALDLRLYLADAADQRRGDLQGLAKTLARLAAEHAEVPIPSYTHLQQAQVTTLGHHLLAYAWMALRDADRFADARSRVARSPLGAGASAGSSLPLDRKDTAEALGMEAPIPNSLDAVAGRDFVAEYVFCCTQAMTHISRLAEELVIWSTAEFGWVKLGDQVSTGSSALPQKRNPDIAELARGRAATVAGDLTAIISLQKALPLAYNRDLQEDKRIVFHADDTLAGTISAIDAMLGGITFDPPAPKADTAALDLAEALVRRGVPFREAHTVVGGLVRHLEESGRSMAELSSDDLSAVDGRFEASDVELVDPRRSLELRVSEGSGSPASVAEQVEAIRQIVGD